MSALKRILALVAVLLSFIGILMGVTAGAGVWVIREPATAKAIYVFERVDFKLNVAEQGLDHVNVSLARAAERLAAVKAEQRAAKSSASGVRRLMARTVQQRVAPEMSDAHQHIHTVAEAVVVVNTIMEDVGNFPLFSLTGLDVGDLDQINDRLTQVESSAWELTRLLADPTAKTDEADESLSKIERSVAAMQNLVALYGPKLVQFRQRTDQLKELILNWTTPLCAALSFICFWIALGQLCLLLKAWSWLRGPAATAS